MLTVIWYITTLILTKELVMADDDQCTDFQFLPGESCEGIYTPRIQRARLNQDIIGSWVESIVG